VIAKAYHWELGRHRKISLYGLAVLCQILRLHLDNGQPFRNAVREGLPAIRERLRTASNHASKLKWPTPQP